MTWIMDSKTSRRKPRTRAAYSRGESLPMRGRRAITTHVYSFYHEFVFCEVLGSIGSRT